MTKYITPTSSPHLVVLRLGGLAYLTTPARAEQLLLEYWSQVPTTDGEPRESSRR